MSENRLGEYLRARREQARPEDFGLADLGRRRVPGLRREELAMLAGISADYYVRLERGRDRHPSEQVLDALARVLNLDDDAAGYLAELARPDAPRRRRTVRPERVRPSVERLLQRWPDTPAFVLGRFMDVLAYNKLAGALHSTFGGERNMLRLVFLDPGARHTYPDWDDVAAESVATLRAAAVNNLDHPRLTELVGELSLKSPEFGRLWSRHDVRAKTAGSKRIRHPMVGELTLAWETFAVSSTPGQLVVAYQAEPGSESERALALLTSAIADDPAPREGWAHSAATGGDLA